MSSSSLFQLAASLSYLLFLSHGVSTFDIVKTSPKQNVAAGSTLRLSCVSDSYFEFCTWRHQSHVCEFEWKKSHDAVLKQRCTPYLNDRIKFKGNYERHECLIEVENVRPEDVGQWSCEMESYVWGIGRGTVKKKAIQVSVVSQSEGTAAPPPSTTETLASSTDSPPPSSSHKSELEVTSVTTPSQDVETRILGATTEDQYDYHDGHYNDTDTSDQALVSVDDSGEEDLGPTVSYAGIIVGTFFGLFIVMLLIAFFGYRQYRRQNKSGAHWEGLSRDEDDLEENATAEPIIRNTRLELTNIVEEEGEQESAEKEKVVASD